MKKIRQEMGEEYSEHQKKIETNRSFIKHMKHMPITQKLVNKSQNIIR